MRVARQMAVATVLACCDVSGLHAETCTRDTLRRVVDEAGARLCVLTAEKPPRLMSALRRLKEKRGWTGPEGDEKATSVISDQRTAELDSKAATLLARIDELSETSGSGGEPDCSRLAELEATSLELQATVRTKSQHILSRLEQEAGESPQVSSAPPAADPRAPILPPQPAAPLRPAVPEGKDATPQKPPATVSKDVLPPVKEAPAPSVPAPRTPPTPHREANAQPAVRAPLPAPAIAKPPAGPVSGWSTETRDRPTGDPASGAVGQPSGLPPIAQEPASGFSREQIAEASRGFFGTISGGLANVIEHAFSTLGKPTGYVLGSEGGGAFIAGLRYGKGTLFLVDGSSREVHWHGPSIGYDFGASGSKTMFLVYNLRRDIDIFTGYSGIDGSAYLVGGVGMTVLTDGKVVMAPIRSGLGVRLGANIGYIRFTARPTWNPF